MASSLVFPSFANPSEDAKALVEDVVRLVDDQYLNQSQLSSKWSQWRQTLLTKTYSDEGKARADIALALRSIGDPYTYFISPSEFEALQRGANGGVADVGVRLVFDQLNRPAIASPPVLNSPAFFAGVQKGDVILAVDGHSTEARPLSEIIRKIQGQENSTVTLTLLRSNNTLTNSSLLDEPFEVALARTDLSQPTVSHTLATHQGSKVGYIRLSRFDNRAIREMKNAIESLEKRSVDGYVLDLRSNAGGRLDASTAIAEMFLDGDTIVTIEERDRTRQVVDKRPPLTDKPIAILVNGGSASSSEVLTAALQDAQRATVVGTQTYGKGVIQMIYMLSDESCLAITTAEYRTPAGYDLHQRGLTPDIYVEMTEHDRTRLANASHPSISTLDPQYRAALDSLFGETSVGDPHRDVGELAMSVPYRFEN